MALRSTTLKPSLWLRYKDDTLILCSHQENVWVLLDHMNSIWPSIQFTMEKEQEKKLSFLPVLITHSEQRFRLSVYRKSTFTGQYLNFNSHNPYQVKNGIVHYLQHLAKAINSDSDAYQEEIKGLRNNLHHNNYSECITSAPRNLDWMTENIHKFTTVCLLYIKDRA